MLKLFFCFWLTLFAARDFHPIHVSVTEINHDEEDKTLEIMIRVFADDLETTMRRRHAIPDLDIQNPQPRTLDELMKEYLESNFVVMLDGRQQTLNYLGNEKDGEAFIFYVEINRIRKWKSIWVTNAVLTEIFEDQSNLVHVTSGGDVRSLRLNKDNPSGVVSFEK
jgi:hypothetical protein